MYQRYYYLITNEKIMDLGFKKVKYYLSENEESFYWCPNWKIFENEKDATEYLSRRQDLVNCRVEVVDTNNECFSKYSCDDCCWGGNCPRHHEKCWDDK